MLKLLGFLACAIALSGCATQERAELWTLDRSETRAGITAHVLDRVPDDQRAQAEARAEEFSRRISDAYARLELYPDRTYRWVGGNNDGTFASAGTWDLSGDLMRLTPDPEAQLEHAEETDLAAWVLRRESRRIRVYIPNYPPIVLRREN